MNYYYLDAANQRCGPLSLDEIRRQAAAGALPPNPLVAIEGSDAWQPLAGVVNAPPRAAFEFEHVLANAAGTSVGFVRGLLGRNVIDAALDLARRGGQWVVTIGAVLGVIYAIYFAIQARNFGVLIAAVLLVVGLAFAQFAARRFFEANRQLLTPTLISSEALLECMALLALMFAIGGLVTAVFLSISYGAWQPLVPAILMAIFWTTFAGVALHPESVSVQVAPVSGGEQVVGLLAFICKALLKLVPLGFFLMAVLGLLTILFGFFDRTGYATQFVPDFLPLPRVVGPNGLGSGFRGVGTVITACLLPVIAHVVFIVVALPIDLWRSILAVPAKLDALKR